MTFATKVCEEVKASLYMTHCCHQRMMYLSGTAHSREHIICILKHVGLVLKAHLLRFTTKHHAAVGRNATSTHKYAESTLLVDKRKHVQTSRPVFTVDCGIERIWQCDDSSNMSKKDNKE